MSKFNAFARVFSLALVTTFVFTLLFNSLSYKVSALSQDDIHAIQNDSVWHKIYPKCDSGTTPAGAKVSKPGLVFLIGDSIGSQVLGTLNQAFSQQTGWSFGGDAVPSRALSGGAVSPDGLGAVDKNTQSIQGAASVVVELGTNTAGFSPENVDQMINKIRSLAPSAIIYWVDTAVVSRPDYATSLSGVNNVIYSQSTADNYQIISWNKKVFGDGADPKNINSDAPSNGLISTADGLNVHLTDAGTTAMTDLITSTVTGTSSSSTQSATSTATTCCGSGAAALLSGSTNPEKVWNYLVGTLGLNAIQAAAVMGNMQQESNFDPTATNGIGAHGIVQWVGGRRTGLQEFAAQRGTDENDLATQLDYLKTELEGPYKATVYDPLKAATDLQSATLVWLEYYEVPCLPGHCQDELAVRLPFAQNWFAQFGSGTSGGTSSGAACGATSAAKDITYKDRAELVQRIKSNPEFQVSTKHGYPVENDIDTVWSAVTTGATKGTQDAILKTLVIILEQYAQPNNLTIPIELFNQTQGACGDFDKGATNYGPYTSSHAYGLAMDIDTTSMDPQDAAQLFKWIYDNKDVLQVGELEHDPVADGASNIKFGGDYTYPDAVQADHRDHIHVGVKGTGAVSPGCTPKPSGETV